jgi:hypothetical protein
MKGKGTTAETALKLLKPAPLAAGKTARNDA